MRFGILFVSCAAFLAATAGEGPMYKVKDEVVVSGKVVSVTSVPDWMGKDGLNIALQGAEVSAPHVDVATASFLKMLEFPIGVGDELQLTGCWSTSSDGQAVFLVHTLKNRKVTLNVRDPGGSPLW